MLKLLAGLISAILGIGAPLPVLGPYTAATNHSDDIMGTPDTRPDTWGLAGANVHTLVFHPPAGYRTRVLRVWGNAQGWLRSPGGPGKCTGVLWGLSTTAPDGSTRVTPAADNTFLYVQDATCGAPFKIDVNADVRSGGLLLPDNTLVSKVAVFMNETGMPVHIEPSFTIEYQFEPIGSAPTAKTGTSRPTPGPVPVQSQSKAK